MHAPKNFILGSALTVLASHAVADHTEDGWSSTAPASAASTAAGYSGDSVANSGAGYQCPLMMPEEVTALKYAYAIQNWLKSYYNAKGGYDASAFEGFPNSSMTQSNGESLASNLAMNMAGLQQQSELGVDAITMLGGDDLAPGCEYTYPAGIEDSSMTFAMTSYFIEATLCGAFIGLGAYVQTPQAAFLMARLAAEHGIHASFLGSYFNPVPYSADSMSLTPAFTPEHVLMAGDGTATRPNVGYLGEWIPASCVPTPPAPCGNEAEIGDLNVMLSGGEGAMPNGGMMGGAAGYGAGEGNDSHSSAAGSGYGAATTMAGNGAAPTAGAAAGNGSSAGAGSGYGSGYGNGYGNGTSDVPVQVGGAAGKTVAGGLVAGAVVAVLAAL